MKEENADIKREIQSVYQRMVGVMLDFDNLVYLEENIHPDFIGYGTAKHEFLKTREDLKKMAQMQKDQLEDQEFRYDRRLVSEKLFAGGNACLILEEFQLFLPENDHQLQVRLSTLLEKIDGKWLVTHYHGSTPDTDIAEEEAFPEQGLRRKNEELEAKIKERTRELEIEAALERTRARSMQMQHSGELNEISKNFHRQIRMLGIDSEFSFVWLPNEAAGNHLFWAAWIEDADEGADVSTRQIIYPLDKSEPYTAACFSDWESGVPVHEHFVKPADLDTFFASWEELLAGASKLKAKYFPEGIYYTEAFIKYGCFGIDTRTSLTEEKKSILHRFAIEFERTYTRFLDLKKAEAQAREAQVEAALERVRSRTMGMQSSDELRKVVLVINEQLQQLYFDSKACNIIILDKETGDANYWVSGFTKDIFPVNYHVPFMDHPYYEALLDPWKKGKPYAVYAYEGADKKNFDKRFFSETGFKEVPEEARNEMMGLPDVTLSTAYFANGAIQVLGPEALSDEKELILRRFANVFEQTYTRFLDLQKAEAQAREAQVEAALERVRAGMMAMHKSDELRKVIKTIFEQLRSLDFNADAAAVIIYDEDYAAECWYSGYSLDTYPRSYTIPYNEKYSYCTDLVDAWKNGVEYLSITFEGKQKADYDHWLMNDTDFKDMPEEFKQALSLDCVVINDAFNKYGMLELNGPEALSEEKAETLKRFSKVFEQTYTRFLDLQQAEAQAREAQIEAALERLRAASMAMHASQELIDTATVMFQELKSLGMTQTASSSFVIIDEKNSRQQFWGAQTETDLLEQMEIPLLGDSILQKRYDAWKRKEPVFCQKVGGKQLHDTMAIALPEASEEIEKAKASMPDPTYFYCGNFSHGYLHIIASEPLSEEHESILHRFTKAFQLTYTRFLDLQQAEAQAREAQIENALEKVRSRSIGMQKSEELREVIQVIHDQLIQLNFQIDAAGFTLDYHQNNDWNVWIANKSGSLPSLMFIPYIDHPQFNYYKYAKEKGLDFLANTLSFEEKNSIFQYMFQFMGDYPQAEKDELLSKPGLAISQAFLKNISLWIYNLDAIPYSEEENNTLMRFAKVFEQTYMRFLDLRKAEAQAREAQIETALERVRAGMMAMHKSDELRQVIKTIFEQLQALDFGADGSAVIIYDDNYGAEHWFSGYSFDTYPKSYTIPYIEKFKYNTDPVDAWRNGVEYQAFPMEGKAKTDYGHWLLENTEFKDLPKEFTRHAITPDRLVLNDAFNKYGMLEVLGPNELSEQNADILKRFSRVFEQTYTRFLDLQRAEAQAREAGIEASLERVRSRTMGMQKSEELKAVIRVIFDQLALLNINAEHAGIVVDYQPGQAWNFWIAETQDIPSRISVPYLDLPWDRQFAEAKEKGKDFFTTQLNFEEKNSFYEKLLPHIPGITKKVRNFYFKCPGLAISTVIQKDIGLYIENFSGTPYSEEENDILMRFGTVFQQTYTRFLDLKKAEAQAREAKIEAALEKVRSRTMAMQHSDELPEAANVLFLEVQALGIPAWSAGYNILAEDKKSATCWMSSEGALQEPFMLRLWGENSFEEMGAFIRSTETFMVQELGDKAIVAHYDHMKSFPDLLPIFEHLQEEGLSLPTYQINHLCKFSQGFLLFITYEKVPDAHEIFNRFTSVFEQTYTRFLDLKRAEAQARESKIETALERVRARALAMQQPEELKEVARVMRQEMGLLGVEELETSSIYIHDQEAKKTECWYAIKDIRKKEKIMVADHFVLDLKATWVGREMLKFYKSKKDQVSIVMKGEARKEWITYCEKHSKALQGYYGEVIPERTYHLYKFSHGAIGVATPADLSEESWGLLKRAASVFSLAYSRFKDLTQARIDLQRLKEEKKRAEDALKELQLTQQQLVHAEKMASLGELTAGIAHEIQNPLNFVNNFSEVSRELLEEMIEELKNGDEEEVDAIAQDVIQNLEKINHHGKRADSIVKGMLQHSRSGDGKKETTDLNVLADEYLRLAYHGLRAKDKSFNSHMETAYDDSLDMVEVIPQDIGRVLLNLLTNAFHAVGERKQKEPEGFEPTVWVSTQQTDKGVELSVRDNGGGIPDKIRDKIFQPFFTTKPTGQGTGLGLSMSYDIVTKGHGGSLKVKSEEGKGTEFILNLPIA